MRRRGFTLVEMMIATAISGALLVALATLYLGADRLIRGMNADVRHSLSNRVERERTVFAPVQDGGVYFLPTTGLVTRATGGGGR